MLCLNCSAPQKIEDIYCPNCGALIEVDDDTQSGKASAVPGSIEHLRLFSGGMSKVVSILGLKQGQVRRKILAGLFLLILAVLVVGTLTPGIL
jgi:hypothetical protein